MYNSKRLTLSSLSMCTYHAFLLHMSHRERESPSTWYCVYTHTLKHTELFIHFMHTSCRSREVYTPYAEILNPC